MKRRPRLRRFLKWAGLAGSAVFLIAWGVSVFFACAYVWHRAPSAEELRDPDFSGGYEASAWLSNGCFRFERFASYKTRIEPYWLFKRDRGATMIWVPRSSPLVAQQSRGPNPIRKAVGSQTFFPLWIPFVLIAVPTAFLWYGDRYIPPGHCQKCGYDLTGNTSGVCPECGERI